MTPPIDGKTLAKKRVCIVTPDIIGPIHNGGIGTHAYYLALELAAVHDVTVLFTGPIEHQDESHWLEFYRARKISFVHLNEVEKPVSSNADWFIKRSYVVYQFLKNKDFDFIHFQEWQANGLHCILAKQTTPYFQNTTLTVDMHSSTEWIHEGKGHWVHWPVPDAKLEWCERYCCQFADIVISPSQYMFDYCEGKKWEFTADRRVMRNCFDRDALQEPAYVPEEGVLVFFGRLETRKGLELFLSAVESLSDEELKKINKIVFVGKSEWLAGLQRDATHFISETMRTLGLNFAIRTDLDSMQAIDFIRAQKALMIVPSIVDNYPYTIVEAQMHGIPVIASNVGGIPELLSEDCLFVPNTRGLAAKLREVLAGKIPASGGKYDPQVAAAAWLDIHNEPVKLGKRASARAKVEAEAPFVSICVPYYNYGQYLEPMIQALSASTYSNFEVIIVNDGSTDKASADKFVEMKETSTDSRFVFLSKINGGIGAARNFAADNAKGDYLIFCDADNCSTPEMIEEFVTAIFMTGGDVVTCNYKAFAETIFWPEDDTKIEYIYLPIGPAMEVGMVANVFGDANSIMRKSAFDAIGGFQTERHTSWEDWDILARFCLAGYRLDVCPEELFWYRHTDAGFSRNTSFYQNHQRILRAYADYGPRYMGPMLRNLVVPLHYGMDREHQLANQLSRDLHSHRVGATIKRETKGLWKMAKKLFR